MTEKKETYQTDQQLAMDAVTDAIAQFQASLEKSFKIRSVVFTSTVGAIVQAYATSLMTSYGLLDRPE